MRIIICQSDEPSWVATEESIILVPSDWDDYSYRTDFTVYYAQPAGILEKVGEAKILARSYRTAGTGQKLRTRDELPTETDVLNPDQFCSLGEEGWYYDRLGKLPNDAGRRILHALNDVCFSAHPNKWWLKTEGFEISLLRTASARISRERAKDLFAGRPFEGQDKGILRFRRHEGFALGGPDVFEAQFDGTLRVPGRMHVVVGKNGVGKTSLLAGLAKWFGRQLSRDTWTYRPEYSRIVVLTYNPFDETLQGRETEGNVRYLGRQPPSRALHRLMTETLSSELNAEDWWTRLRQQCPTPRDLYENLGTLSSHGIVMQSATALVREASWGSFLHEALEDTPLVEQLITSPVDAYTIMSAGQRALVGLWASLYINMAPQSLVLIDEPENFLHPSLVARFARSFNILLTARKSFSVVATHSPIIVQETPARFVTILERAGDQTTARPPEFETFGESTDNLSERLFETDFRSSHWKRVLSDFAKQGIELHEVANQVSGVKLPLLAETYFIYQRQDLKTS